VLLAEPVLIVFTGIFGSLLGSFLNVCVYRLPRDESVIHPRSRCPSCQTPIAWYDNVPVLSWLLLLGKCRHCKARISARYPIVELIVAGVWAGSIAWLGPTVEALSAALLTTLLIGILLTDAQHYIIPDEFSLGGLGAGIGLSLAPDGLSPVQSLAGAALGFGLMWAAGVAGKWWAKRDAMGGGDLKMMAMVGSFLGWRGVLLTLFLGSLVGTLVFLPSLLRRERFREVPFGVFLAMGGVAALVAGDRLSDWYFHAVGWR
jgi:leader peptidase (prepilin peptidase)/N-methyltransferase